MRDVPFAVLLVVLSLAGATPAAAQANAPDDTGTRENSSRRRVSISLGHQF